MHMLVYYGGWVFETTCKKEGVSLHFSQPAGDTLTMLDDSKSLAALGILAEKIGGCLEHRGWPTNKAKQNVNPKSA